MIKLIICGETPTKQHLSIQKHRVSIGREPDNDVVLSALEVSRHHAEIHQRNGEFILIDLNSTNGTFIGKRKVESEQRLEIGEAFHIGYFDLCLFGE